MAWRRVETERQKHRSRAFRALKFSIRAISSTIFDFEFSIRAISSRKVVEHFEHRKISSDHRAISSIILEKISSKTEHFSSEIKHFPSIIELNLLSTLTSGKYFKLFENFCMKFEQSCEEHRFFSFSQHKKCKYFQLFLIKL